MLTHLVAFLAGCAFTAALTWCFRLTRPSAAFSPLKDPSNFYLPPGFPPLKAEAQLWLVPDAHAQRMAVMAVSSLLADRGPVLLLPRTSSRPEMASLLRSVDGIYWMDRERPEVSRMLRVVETLERLGPPAIVVEGTEALEEPATDEPADAVLEEAIECCQLDVIIILLESDMLPRQPELRLEPIEGGLATPGSSQPLICYTNGTPEFQIRSNTPPGARPSSPGARNQPPAPGSV